MINLLLPSGIEGLRVHAREFIRTTAIPAGQPRPGVRLGRATRDRLQAAPKAAVFSLRTSPRELAARASLSSTGPRSSRKPGALAKAIYRVIDRAIQFRRGDGVSDGLPLASYLNEVRPFHICDCATETHEWAVSRRASARRTAAVEAHQPYLADEYNVTAGVH